MNHKLKMFWNRLRMLWNQLVGWYWFVKAILVTIGDIIDKAYKE